MPRSIHIHSVPAVAVVLASALLYASQTRALDPTRDLAQLGQQVWLTENGLPQNTVHSVIQTSDGFIWIATEGGVARFDGISFMIFDRQNTPQLKTNDIRCLAEDQQGRLWIGTADGLVRFFNGEFRSFTQKDGLPADVIDSLYEDMHGNLWIGTASGLARIRDGDFASREIVTDKAVQSLFEDREGTFWIGTAGGLNQVKDGKFFANLFPENLGNSSVLAISQDRDGRRWFGTADGLIGFADGRFRTYSSVDGLPDNRITSLVALKESGLWVGTAHGLARLDGDHLSRFGPNNSVASNTILSLFEDREGSLWVGAELGGLNLIKDKKFATYTMSDGLGSDVVKAVYEDERGNVWVGTNGGGLGLLKDNHFTNYTTKDGLSSNVVFALCGQSDGTLWIGTPDGLNRFKEGKFTIYTSADGLANDFVRSLYVDHEGTLWIGTRGGLTRMKDGVIATYTTAQGLPDNFVGVIYEDSARNLWIGTLAGLTRFNHEKFATYTTRDGLASDVVISLYEDRDGVFWIGTNGGGLNRLAHGQFTAFSTKDGLPDDVVFRILEDEQNNLWLSSKRGIFRLNKKELNDFAAGRISSLNPTLYGPADGMLTRECSGGGHPAGWKGRDGRLWFSTIKGLAMIDPARVRTNYQPPPVVIDGIKVDDQPISLYQKAELSPGKSRFDFYYAGLSFIAPDKVRFKYKLEGFDKDWVEAGTRRVASYTNLPPGRYSFKVIACNNDGVWSESAASFDFYLQPHFYRTYWFYSLLALALALLIWQFYRLRVRQIQGQFSAVLAERTRIARDIHDNLAQEMLGISMQLEVVARTIPPSADVARNHLDRVRMLVRHGIAEARRYVWDLRSQALENKDLAAALADTARRLTADTTVYAQVQVSGTFRPLPEAVESNLLRICQEAINNAVRHAQAQRILVSLDFEIAQVRLTVRDNGRGFEYKFSSNGDSGHFGLVSMRERAEAMGGKFEIISRPNEGTEVNVAVPLSVDAEGRKS